MKCNRSQHPLATATFPLTVATTKENCNGTNVIDQREQAVFLMRENRTTNAVDASLRSGSDNDVTNMADFNLPLQLTIKPRLTRERQIGISEVARGDG